MRRTENVPRIHVRPWTGDAIELSNAAALYAAVFAEHPYQEDPEQSRATFLDRVQRYRLGKPHFRLRLAWRDDAVVGLALGNGITAGDWWRDSMIPQLPRDITDDWFGDEAFAVVELATSSAHRRSGVAGVLLASLLEGLPYPTAVLSAYWDAIAARKFYRANGWQEIAGSLRLGESPELCLLGMRMWPAADGDGRMTTPAAE